MLLIALAVVYGIRYGGAREDILLSAYIRIDEKYTARYSYDEYIYDIWEDILVHSAGESLGSDSNASFYRIKGRDSLENIIIEVGGKRYLGEFESLFETTGKYNIKNRPALLYSLQIIYDIEDEKKIKKIRLSYRDNSSDIKQSYTDKDTLTLFSSILLCEHVNDRDLYVTLIEWPNSNAARGIINKYGTASSKIYKTELEYFFEDGISVALTYNSVTGSVKYKNESFYLIPDELNNRLISFLGI
ncbi:MAG: hypothetical protein AB9835_01175 [Eubacteriales bacterium]